jgi:hypothetical protein
MATGLFDAGREGFLGGTIDWDTHNLKLILIDAGADAPVLATDNFLDDILAGARIRVSANGDTGIDVSGYLTSKTITGGVADAADVTLVAVGTAASCEGILIYYHTGTEATSALICYIDSATGLPVTPNGGNISITWDAGANKIFKL